MGYKDDAKVGGRQRMGTYMLKPGIRHTLWSPSWSDKDWRPTVVVPFGIPNDTLTGFLPHRNTPESQDYGDWIKSVPVFKGGSYSKVTIVAGRRDPTTGHWLEGAEGNTMAHKLLKTFHAMKNAFPHWKVLEEGGAGKSPAIDDIKRGSMLQGAVMAHNGKSYANNPVFPVVLLLTSSAVQSLEAQLDTEVEGYDGDPSDIYSRFIAGDLLNPDGYGKMLQFFCSKTSADMAVQAGAAAYAAKWGQGGAGQPRSGERSREVSYFKCELLDSPSPLPRLEDGRLRFDVEGQGFRAWEELIRFDISDEEMVNVLCEAYEDYPDLIKLAFEETGLLSQRWYERQARAEAAKQAAIRRADAPKAGFPGVSGTPSTAAPAAGGTVATPWGRRPTSAPPVAPPAAPPAQAAEPPDDINMGEFPPAEGGEPAEREEPAVDPVAEPEPVVEAPVVRPPPRVPAPPAAQKAAPVAARQAPSVAWGNGGPAAEPGTVSAAAPKGPPAFGPSGASASFPSAKPPVGDSPTRTAAALAALESVRRRAAGGTAG